MIITDFLPQKNALNDDNNLFADFINDTIGKFFDEFVDEIDKMNDELFIQNCEKYLDFFGIDYNLPRFPEEIDEHYRKRIITISSKRFTINTLYNEYDLQLLTYTPSASGNTLLSDNHYLNNKYYVICEDIVWDTISNKYITGLERLELGE